MSGILLYTLHVYHIIHTKKNPTYKIGTVIVLHCTEKESEAQEN